MGSKYIFMLNSHSIYKAGLKRPLNGDIDTLTWSCALGCLCTSCDGCGICKDGGTSPTIDKAHELTLDPVMISRNKKQNPKKCSYELIGGGGKRSQYRKSRYLTSSYHAAGGDRQPAMSNNSED